MNVNLFPEIQKKQRQIPAIGTDGFAVNDIRDGYYVGVLRSFILENMSNPEADYGNLNDGQTWAFTVVKDNFRVLINVVENRSGKYYCLRLIGADVFKKREHSLGRQEPVSLPSNRGGQQELFAA